MIIQYDKEIFGIKQLLLLQCVRWRGRRTHQAIAHSRMHLRDVVYLLEQCIHSQIMFSVLYPQLVAHIYGYVEDEAFSMAYYYWVLVDSECRCSALSEIF